MADFMEDDFNLGIPDDFNLPNNKFGDKQPEADKYAKKLQDEFFNHFLHGEWQPIIKRDFYDRLLAWFKDYNWNAKVVVRFKFLEAVADQPFAIYCICHPIVRNGKVAITQICKPEMDLFKNPEKKKFLLAIPSALRKRPMFCVPASAIVGLELE